GRVDPPGRQAGFAQCRDQGSLIAARRLEGDGFGFEPFGPAYQIAQACAIVGEGAHLALRPKTGIEPSLAHVDTDKTSALCHISAPILASAGWDPGQPFGFQRPVAAPAPLRACTTKGDAGSTTAREAPRA